MMRGQCGHRHLLGSVLRAAAAGATLVVAPAVIVGGDLLVLPAVALVLLAWLAIGLVAVVDWVLTVGGPPLLTTAGTAAAGGWSAIREDPVGRSLHALAAPLGRIGRPLRRPGRWLRHRLSLGPA